MNLEKLLTLNIKILIKFNWVSHKKILNLYKKTLISITPSYWEEPFGRTSMEASNLGNIVIHSGTGGLNETTNSKLILKKKTVLNCMAFYQN